MLPDYTNVKRRLLERLHSRLRATMGRNRAPLSMAVSRKLQEGDRFVLIRADGSRHAMRPREISVPIELRREELEEPSLQAVMEKVDKATEELSFKQFKMITDAIDEATRKVGNVMPISGSITPDDYFRMLEKLQIDFDREGKVNLPNLCANPSRREELVRLFQELESNPDHRRRLDELIDRKRGEWRDRESARTLVD